MLCPPFPRRRESLIPQAPPRLPRLLLGGRVGAAAVARVIKRLSCSHHRRGEVFAASLAPRHGAAVAVGGHLVALDQPALGEPDQRLFRGPAAVEGLSAPFALLPQLRRVNTPQPDTLAVDLQRVPIGHRHVGRSRRARRQGEERQR